MTEELVTLIGSLAAIFTTSAFLPQVIKTWKTKRTQDISLLTYLILTTGLLLWFIYGLMIQDFPLILANGISCLLSSSILIFKLKHG